MSETFYKSISRAGMACAIALMLGFFGHDNYVESVARSTGNYAYRRHAFGAFYNPRHPAILQGKNVWDVDPAAPYALPKYSFASAKAESLAKRVQPVDLHEDQHHKHFLMDENRDMVITEDEVRSYKKRCQNE